MATRMQMTMQMKGRKTGVRPPAGFGNLVLNAKKLTLNGKYLILRNS